MWRGFAFSECLLVIESVSIWSYGLFSFNALFNCHFSNQLCCNFFLFLARGPPLSTSPPTGWWRGENTQMCRPNPSLRAYQCINIVIIFFTWHDRAMAVYRMSHNYMVLVVVNAYGLNDAYAIISSKWMIYVRIPCDTRAVPLFCEWG